MIVYLAQPIDRAGVVNPLGRVKQTITNRGHIAYSPAGAWAINPAKTQPTNRVERINRVALAEADLLIAYLPNNIPTVGVPMEIEYAVGRGIPVAVITDLISYSLHNRPGITVCADADEVNTWLAWQENLPERPPRPDHHIQVVMAEGAEPPVRRYPDDAGIDLVTAETTTVEPGRFANIPTTVEGIQLPEDTWGMITGRSSTIRQWGLHVPVSVIDPGWRGPLLVGAYNLTQQRVTVAPGQRVGQLVCLHNRTAELGIIPVKQLESHPRGLNGFGSTGV